MGSAVVVRARGRSLAQVGVPDPLQDPVLELRDSSGNLIAANNNWKDSQEALISGAGLSLTDDRESGIYLPLLGGSYTAIVRGLNNTTGTAVLEVYNIQFQAARVVVSDIAAAPLQLLANHAEEGDSRE